ncbi:MAG TPA: glycosyltransferase family 4 protein [Acidimicrobiales bacterium]|nr:glycosyltransferase family 4 protein [Acidimicrobiales bacterium]
MQLVLSAKWVTIGGGVEMQTLQMSRELALRGHRIDLLFNRDGDLGPEFRSFCHSMSQVPTFRFSRKRALRDLVSLTPAVRAAVRAHPEVVYISQPDHLAFGLLSGMLSRSPVVCHLHGWTQTGLIPRLASHANRLIACSEFVRDRAIESGVPPQKVVVVHNGVNLKDYPPATAEQRSKARRALGLPDDAFVCLFFGRLDTEKGIEVLLNAWRHLGLAADRARLLIVGSPSLVSDPQARLRELHAMAPTGCAWLPMQRDVVTPLQAADVVAVPSNWDEPFPRVVLEGMAAGLPVVASRVGGIPEALTGEMASFLFERASEDELADRLASLVDWRKDRPDLGLQCSAHIAGRFEIEGMVDGVERVLFDAVGGSDKSS